MEQEYDPTVAEIEKRRAHARGMTIWVRPRTNADGSKTVGFWRRPGKAKAKDIPPSLNVLAELHSTLNMFRAENLSLQEQIKKQAATIDQRDTDLDEIQRKLADAAHKAEMAEIKAKAGEAKAEAYFERVGERQVVIDELKQLIIDMVRD
jgi:hypothetical protein